MADGLELAVHQAHQQAAVVGELLFEDRDRRPRVDPDMPAIPAAEYEGHGSAFLRTGQKVVCFSGARKGGRVTTHLNDDGQPPKRFYAGRVQYRLVSELLGLCKGMICDGEITEVEAVGLKRWIAGHPDVLVEYPGNVLGDRLLQIFADGVVDDDEREELSTLLLDLTGETEERDQPLNLSTRLPLDDPPPTVLFDGQEYVFTGQMLYATRKQCAQAVTDRGARVAERVTRRTTFLVVGPIASEAWIESTHGTKIVHAVELKNSGHPIHIISEEVWVQALDQ